MNKINRNAKTRQRQAPSVAVRKPSRTCADTMGHIRGRSAPSTQNQRIRFSTRPAHSIAVVSVAAVDLEVAWVAEATEVGADSKAAVAADNTIPVGVRAVLLVAIDPTTTITTITTTNIMETIAVVVVVKSRVLEIKKDNEILVPLLVPVA
jgi:hypothetical protein